MKSLYFLSVFLIFSRVSIFGQESPDLSKFSKKQIEIIDSLNFYIDIIIDKDSQYEVIIQTRKKAESLFNSNAIVTVSSPSYEGDRKYKAGSYLARIQLLKYDEVNIEEVEFGKKNEIMNAKLVQIGRY